MLNMHQEKVPENLGHLYCDSEVISSFILEVLLMLARFWMNTPNYRQYDRLLESCFRL